MKNSSRVQSSKRGSKKEEAKKTTCRKHQNYTHSCHAFTSMASFAPPTTRQSSISKLMTEWRIKSDVVVALQELGVEEPSDILDLTNNDIEEFILDTKLKKVEANRFRNGVNAMVAAASSSTSLPNAPLAPSAQSGSSDDLPIAVTAVLLTSNASNSSCFEDNEKMIRDQLEREYRSQLADQEAQIQRLQALALTSSSAGETKASSEGETKASSVRIDCFFLSIILCLS